MKFSLSFLFLLIAFCSKGQIIRTAQGEFIDTTTNRSAECGNDISNYYYSLGTKYPKSSSSLLREVQSLEKESKSMSSGDGYITFRFTVDCKGKRSTRVEVLQTDGKYQRIHFDEDYVRFLYNYISTLNEWKVAKSAKDVIYNYHAFITFKIKNGKVDQVIP